MAFAQKGKRMRFRSAFSLFIAFSWALACSPPLFAQSESEELSDGLAFDEQALAKVAQAETVEEMAERIRKEYGVVVLELPGDDDKVGADFSSVAWIYHHLEGKNRHQGFYLGPYLPLPAEGAPKGSILLFNERPHGEKDLIGYRRGSTRGVLLHEFAHFLIEKRRRERNGHTPFQSAEARLRNMLGSDDQADGFALGKRWAENGISALREEMRINHHLLAQRKALNLDLADVQFFLRTIRRDIPAYLKQEKLEELSQADQAKVDAILARATTEFEQKNAAFLHAHDRLRTLDGLNRKRIFLVPPDFTKTDPYRVMGVLGNRDLSEADINAIYRYWVPSYHPDLNPEKGNAEFNRLTSAKEALKSPAVFMDRMAEEWGQSFRRQWQADLAKERAEDERAMRQLTRYLTRFVTQCAVTTAACALDHWLGGGMTEGVSGWPLFWANLAASFWGADRDPQGHDPVKAPVREGLRSGAVRGAVVSGCAKVLELLARF